MKQKVMFYMVLEFILAVMIPTHLLKNMQVILYMIH